MWGTFEWLKRKPVYSYVTLLKQCLYLRHIGAQNYCVATDQLVHDHEVLSHGPTSNNAWS